MVKELVSSMRSGWRGREGGKEAVAIGGTKTGPVMLEEGKLRELTMLYACG